MMVRVRVSRSTYLGRGLLLSGLLGRVIRLALALALGVLHQPLGPVSLALLLLLPPLLLLLLLLAAAAVAAVVVVVVVVVVVTGTLSYSAI